jgi:hypothetical protein
LRCFDCEKTKVSDHIFWLRSDKRDGEFTALLEKYGLSYSVDDNDNLYEKVITSVSENDNYDLDITIFIHDYNLFDFNCNFSKLNYYQEIEIQGVKSKDKVIEHIDKFLKEAKAKIDEIE